MQQKVVDQILEWAEHYVRHRHLILRNIEKIDKQPNKLVVTYKNGSVEQFVPFPDLKVLDLSDIKTRVTIVSLNTKPNFNLLIDRWKEFAQAKDLKMIFFNPESEIDKRWIIKPYIHNRVCDDKTLKQGLKTMFKTVEAMA